MNMFSTGMKIVEKVSKPFKIFFGSDEKSFITFTTGTIITYAVGFPDAATILAVYSSIFAYSGMQKYNTNNNSTEVNQDLEDMQDMMDDALGMAKDFQEETQGEKE